MSNQSRRDFMRNASLGTATLGLAGLPGQVAVAGERAARNPREVYIATLTMSGIRGAGLQQVVQAALKQMKIALPVSPDVYCLPEVFHAAGVDGGRPPLNVSAEDGSGNIIEPIQAFARENRCYIICPIYTVESGKYYNAAVIIDRQGRYLGEYRKTRLTEGESRKGLSPGPIEIPVFETDFGRIGIQICFDLEWPEGWTQLSRKGAEVVFFPSAFSGGKRVNAMSLENRYYVVSSTRDECSKICDVTGELALSGGHPSNSWGVVAPVNLERAILHTHSAGTVAGKFPEIREKYGRKVRLHTLGEEHYTVLESLSPDVKVADILREFGVRTYDRHLEIADKLIERGV